MKREQLSSRMRHRMTLQQPVMAPDGAGGFTRSWENIAELWVEIAPYSGRLSITSEPLVDDRLQSRVFHKITLRYRADLTAAMRFLYGERVLHILQVTNSGEQSAQMEILAEEQARG